MPDRIRKGFTLHDLPSRKTVLEHQLNEKQKDLHFLEKKLNRLYYLDDRPGVIMLYGSSPEIQIANLEDKRTGLIHMIKEIKKELETL